MNKRIFQTVLLLMLALFGSTSLLRADELTVYDGTTTNSYVPVYGMWADAYLRCQYVMPAEDLVDMKGADINCMKFYLSQQATAAWTGTFQVYMTEVDYTSISAFIDPSTATTVYQGTLDATGSIMTVEFDSDYSYNGGNLLIGFDQIVKGNYKSAYFYGVSATGASVQGYNSTVLFYGVIVLCVICLDVFFQLIYLTFGHDLLCDDRAVQLVPIDNHFFSLCLFSSS